MLQDLLQETDTAYRLRLHTPCFAVSGIIASVSLGAGLRKVVPHLWINLVYKMLQLGRKLVVSLFGQVFHGPNLHVN